MLRQRQEQIQTLARVLDGVVCALAFLLAYWIRADYVPRHYGWGGMDPIQSVSWILAVSLTVHLILYPFVGFYHSLRLKPYSQIVSSVFRAFLGELFLLGGLFFFVQSYSTSRYFFVLFLVLNYFFVLVEKIAVKACLSSLRRRGYNFRRVVIVGMGQHALRVIDILRKNGHWGYVPTGLLAPYGVDASALPRELNGVPILGQANHLHELVKHETIDEVYFALDGFAPPEALNEEVLLCERLGIPVRFSFGFAHLDHSKVSFHSMDGIPVVTFYTILMTPAEVAVKRVMDIVVALVGLLLTGMLLPWIAFRIKKDSPGPIIFKQIRVGENGRLFKCYKFRTMYVDAEARKQELIGKNQMEGPMFKIDQDPRVTPFGAFLRRSSLDELPQFLNILRGDMSVVGTRPPTPDEVTKYRLEQRRRLSIRPGLTGLWQVSGRNQVTSFEDVLSLDLKYIDNWSIWLDVRIVFQTVWAVLTRKGAV